MNAKGLGFRTKKCQSIKQSVKAINSVNNKIRSEKASLFSSLWIPCWMNEAQPPKISRETVSEFDAPAVLMKTVSIKSTTNLQRDASFFLSTVILCLSVACAIACCSLFLSDMSKSGKIFESDPSTLAYYYYCHPV